MRIEKCWYCSCSIYPGHGIAFVRNDGKMFRFCRSKCHKHFKMKHNPRKTRWTKAFRKSMGKEMTMDSTFEFEKRRNSPVKYNRDLMVKTIKAMKIVDRIRTARRERFHRHRLAVQRALKKGLAEKELAKNAVLMEGPTIPIKKDASMVLKSEETRRTRVAAKSASIKIEDEAAAGGAGSDVEMLD
eukprot:GDKH01000991.1.p1 GENE.GDKH01000991.1~~GDKH01000991.1.p1  ORF type:complete len:186 (-),score=32.37 GDKH01000991.1:111-668(-)